MPELRYQNICASSRGFNIFKTTAWGKPHAYPGLVVAGPDTFYFVVDRQRMLTTGGAIGGALGGALGGAVGGLIDGLRTDKKRRKKLGYLPQEVPLVEELDLTDLPDKITEHRDWPVPWSEGPVIVVPRNAVQGLRTTWWMGGIEMQLDGVVIRTFTPIFKRKKMAAFLVDSGWDVVGLR